MKKLPLPIAGLALGLAALGNLLQSYGETPRRIFGVISALIIILLLVKIAGNLKGVAEELKNPLIASSFGTFPMTLILLSSYLPKEAGNIFFYVSLIIELVYLIAFNFYFMRNFELKKVLPSWFIIYVGMVVASVVAPAFDAKNIGQYIFNLGFLFYIVMLILVIIRLVKHRELPKPAIPTMAIFAAPASLLLAGYLKSFVPGKSVSNELIYTLAFISLFFYFAVLIFTVLNFRKPFIPSYSSYTFPFVISAIAIKTLNGYLTKNGTTYSFLPYFIKFQEFVALFLVLAVLVRYVIFLNKKEA